MIYALRKFSSGHERRANSGEKGLMATAEWTLAGATRQSRLQCWTLFGFLAAAILAAELRFVTVIDWSNPTDIRWLMGINWRLSAPYFLLTFAASPLQRLFPGKATRWLLANRRYLGLSFAVGAFCQIPPIVTLALRFQPSLADIHSASSQFGEDCIYLTLVLMTVTSFRATKRHLSRTMWRRLHASGIYLLAGLYGVSYVYAALYETNSTYVVLGAAFVIVWGLRAAVWWRRRTELGGRKVFWALAGLTNGVMLAAWSWFGIESDATLRVVLAIAMVLACTMLLISLAASPLERAWPHRTTSRLVTERDHFFVAYALALAWYVAFAFAGRVTVLPSQAVALPLPLAVASACGILTLGMLLLLARDLASGRQAFARVRLAGNMAVAVLLTVGLVLGRQTA
jgi:sulfoxide reductase heme-binding subunit YedZ